jgi:hypothetical protein
MKNVFIVVVSWLDTLLWYSLYGKYKSFDAGGYKKDKQIKSFTEICLEIIKQEKSRLFAPYGNSSNDRTIKKYIGFLNIYSPDYYFNNFVFVQ